MGRGIVIGPGFPYALNASQGQFNFLGYDLAGVNRLMSVSPGAFALTGEPAAFPGLMPLSPGAFSLTGEAAAFSTELTLIAGEGSFAFTGESASLGSGASDVIGAGVPAGGTATLDYEPTPLHWNRVRNGRGFTTGINNTSVALDANGWPATAAFYCILGTSGNQSWQTASGGVHYCGFIDNSTGTSAATVAAGGSCSISNLVHGGPGQYTTFTLTATGGNYWFSVGNTATGATNVYAYLPGYAASNPAAIDNVLSDSAYYTPMVDQWSVFGHLRCEELSNAWFCTAAVNAATRHTNLNTQTNPNGGNGSPTTEVYPLEWGIGLANACGNNLYWNSLMNDTNADNSSTYTSSWFYSACVSVKNNLNGVWYTEVTNEIWNSGAGHAYTEMIALANAAGYQNNITGAYQYLGARLHNMANIGRLVFGSQAAFAAKVRLCLCAGIPGEQISQFFLPALTQLISSGGTPSLDLYALHNAPYITSSDSGFSNPTTSSTTAQIVAAVTNRAPGNVTYWLTQTVRVLAASYGLKLGTYESNWDLTQGYTSAYTNITAAITDPTMTAAFVAYWGDLLNNGYDYVTSLSGGYNNYATTIVPGDAWGVNYTTSPPAGRYAALQTLAGESQPQSPVNAVTSGANVPGYAYVDNTNTTNPTMNSNRAPQWSSGFRTPWLLYSATAQTRTLTLSTTGSGTTDVEVNGTVLYTAQALTATWSITLQAGWNALTLGTSASQSWVPTNLGWT